MTERSLQEMLPEIITFAYEHHAGDDYGEYPYIIHVSEVVHLLELFNLGAPIFIAGGWLHDVVEDTAAELSKIRERFGPAVAEVVDFCTDEPGKNRKERKAKTYVKWERMIAEYPAHPGVPVKVCDRIANLLSCGLRGNPSLYSMYAKEHRKFRYTLYPSLVAHYSDLLEHLDRNAALAETYIRAWNFVFP